MMNSKESFDATLVFPPSLLAEAPPISVATLTAYMRHHGIRTAQFDWNASFNQYLLDRVEIWGVGCDVPPDGFTQDFLRYFFLNHITGHYFADTSHRNWSLVETCGPRPESISIWDPPFPFSYCQYLDVLAESPELVLDFISDERANLYHDFYRTKVEPQLVTQKVLGVSIMGYTQVIPALTLCRLLREAQPDVHICWGGPWVTSYYDLFIECLERSPELGRLVDSLVAREGEGPLLEIVQRVLANRSLEGVQNTHVRKDDGTFLVTHDLSWLADLDQLPTPDYDDFDLDQYVTFREGEGSLVIQGSRSCYYMKCSFCNAITNFAPSTYRERSTEMIRRDIDTLLEKHPETKGIDFADAVFPARRLRDIADYFIELGRPDLSWEVDVRFERNIDRPTLELMKESRGTLRLGLETANERLLALVEKGNKMDVVHRFLNDCRDIGYKPFLMTIIGLPSETPDEAEELYHFLRDYHDTVTYQIADFVVERNSPIYFTPDRFGITIPESERRSFHHYIDFLRKEGYDDETARQVYRSILVRTLQEFRGARQIDLELERSTIGEGDSVFCMSLHAGALRLRDYHVKWNNLPFKGLVSIGYKLKQEFTDMSKEGTLFELNHETASELSTAIA